MTLVQVLFAITAAAELLLGGGLVVTLLHPRARVWPPPGRHSWQYHYVWGLTIVSVLGGAAVGVLDWNSSVFDHWLRIPIGGLLVLAGQAFALWGVRSLSLHTSLGLTGAFVQSGAYRYSRNPQYVGDIALLFGFAILGNSLFVLLECLLGAAWFALAPFTEEPWLRERFGSEYEAYIRRVPRFLGLRRSAMGRGPARR